MKMTVITGRGGAIIGTARQTADEGRTPAGSGGPVAGPGQTIHVIDLPTELARIEDSEQLFDKLKRLIPTGKKIPRGRHRAPPRKRKGRTRRIAIETRRLGRPGVLLSSGLTKGAKTAAVPFRYGLR